MTAAASHTAGTVGTRGCAAGVSARRAVANGGLGSAWATPRRQLTPHFTAWARPAERQIESCDRKGFTRAPSKHLQHFLINLASEQGVGPSLPGAADRGPRLPKLDVDTPPPVCPSRMFKTLGSELFWIFPQTSPEFFQ
jgi:hypothetical protein